MSGLLLDTHALLWWLTDDTRLSSAVREVVADRTQDVHVSAASAWEIATKARLGKLDRVPDASERYGELAARNGFTHLPIDHRHALRAGSWQVEHRDPFDRILAAQSSIESLDLVTCDPAFEEFEISTIW